MVTLAEAELVRDGVLQRKPVKASSVFGRLLMAATGSRWEPSQRVLRDRVADFCTYVRCAAAMSSQRLGGGSGAASTLLTLPGLGLSGASASVADSASCGARTTQVEDDAAAGGGRGGVAAGLGRVGEASHLLAGRAAASVATACPVSGSGLLGALLGQALLKHHRPHLLRNRLSLGR